MKIKSSKILICVTGGIAVYKICTLVNFLIKEEAEVKVIMTEAATKFVSPLTFQSLTNKTVEYNLWDDSKYGNIEHIQLAHWPDIVIIAPATANTIAKIANGISDNLVTTVILALSNKIPVILAPAMNTNMWNNPITQKNLNEINILLKNFKIINPRKGILACRDEGLGKIPTNETIIEFIKEI